MYGLGPYAELPFASVGGIAPQVVGVLAVSITPIVNLGSDTTYRTATIAVESGLQVSFTSTIPTYAVGFIQPVVSVSLAGNTTVRGELAATVVPVVSIFGNAPCPILFDLTIKVRPSVTGFVPPAAFITTTIVPVVSFTATAVPSGRLAYTVRPSVSLTAKHGYVGTITTTIPVLASFTAKRGGGSVLSADIFPVVSMTAKHGISATLGVSMPISVALYGGAYQYVQGTLAVSIPISAALRGAFDDNSMYADFVYVKTKQQSVTVMQ